MSDDNTVQPLVPRICDDCYNQLVKSMVDAGYNAIVAIHCPHYLVLMEVEITEGVPLGVIMTGPISHEEAEANINNAFADDQSALPP